MDYGYENDILNAIFYMNMKEQLLDSLQVFVRSL